MRHWTWLAASAALACTSPNRPLGDMNRGGSGGDNASDDGGKANGGAVTGSGGSNSGHAGYGYGNTSAFDPTDGGEAGQASGGDSGEASGGSSGLECDGCAIGGKCLAAGAPNPKNSCEICEPHRSRTAFTANDDAECDDGSACTDDDRCDGGVCQGTARICALGNTTCDEATGKCECSGCAIGASCLASGATNPSNVCEVCTPTISTRAYSPLTGTSCGTTSECDAGVCKPLVNPFDCITPDPPTPTLPDAVYVGLETTPPSPKGGSIAAGRYTPVRIDLYGSMESSIDLRTFEFSKGFAQVATQPWNMDQQVAFIPPVRFAGSYESASNQLTFTLERCDPQYNVQIPSLAYTASANGLQTIEGLEDGGTRVVSYARQ